MNAGAQLVAEANTKATRDLIDEIKAFRADLAAFTKLVSHPMAKVEEGPMSVTLNGIEEGFLRSLIERFRR